MKKTWIGAHSNNFELGRRGNKVSMIIIHWIVGTLKSCDATFNNPNRGASAHYGIGGNEVHQYVTEQDTAYHAGSFDVNLKSIGIEHEGGPSIPIIESTYQSSIELVAELCKRYKIPANRDHIKMHREVSRTGTQCPGTLDIDRITREVAKRIQGGEQPMDSEIVKRADAFIAVCDKLKKPVDKDIVLADIEKLLGLEKTLEDRNKDIIAKEKQMEEIRTNAKDMESTLAKLKTENESLSVKSDKQIEASKKLSEKIEEQGGLITTLDKEVNDLKKQKAINEMSAWEIIFYGISRLPFFKK